MSDREGKYILVIDRQDHWRQFSTEALETEGFWLRVLDHYDYPPLTQEPFDDRPDLIILGCSRIGPEELGLIMRILERNLHLVILSTALPWDTMRQLFLAGADDVTDKPYNSDRLVEIVKEALESTIPYDSFRAVAQKGVV